MALVTCRRFPGRFFGTSSCPALIQHHIDKKLRGQINEGCLLAAKKISTEFRMAAHLQLLKLRGCRAFCTISAHSATQSVTYWNMGSYPQHRRYHPSEDSIHFRPSKNFKSICHTASSQGLLKTSNTLLHLELSRAAASKAGTLLPGSPQGMKVNDEDIEVFDSFEDPRVFLQLRPEYQCHSYTRLESCRPLPVSEGELILHKVTVYQDNLQPPLIADYFCKLSSLPAEQRPILLSNTSFALLCQQSVKKIELFDVPDLISILKAFAILRIPSSHLMLDVYETRFCHKVWEMSLDQLLLVADLWRYLGRKVPRFLEIFFSYLSLHWKNLTLSQLIHLIYIIGENRQAPQDLMQKLESLILRYIDLLKLEEVGTICLGFFKSSSSLSEFLMRRIGDVVCADMQHLSSYALVNILKMFRFTHVDHIQFMKQFGQIAPERIPTLGVQGVMHLTLTCSALRFLDEGIMNAVAVSLPPRVAYCRSKDVAKILWSFGTLNYKPPNAEEFYSSLLSEIHRKLPEFNRYPEHLFTCLLGLAFSGYFPKELIDFALSPKFIRVAQERSKFELIKELCTLDGTVGIECPDYQGSRLSSHLQQEGSEILWNLARKDMTSKPEFVEAQLLLETMLGGPQYVRHHMVLPHTRSSDLEVRLDANMKPVPFNREAVPAEDGTQWKLKYVGISLTDDLMNKLLKGKLGGSVHGGTGQKAAAPIGGTNCNVPEKLGAEEVASLCPPDCMQSPQMKLAIQLTNKNQYCYGSRHLLGLHSMKRRQLNRLGYRVVELTPWEWLPLLKRTRLEKLAFLHEKVFTSAL
ncbi:LOW QUALITY PROTEIN: FAST kinase domain-containing protein 5, mitochondrial [Suncus etruscus]|uniref:LOW QUALITY PROTEIN: FAST kinase domain-containing protein 5, mitochondrial n=1 Tax=Suncus etruscus TaxID=109475 RepID=UPI0021109121|nr:LOW QUALITY PROTEIN: FAST kinase domain-containing protein 5, mitochondrial [Suncus etruscus]